MAARSRNRKTLQVAFCRDPEATAPRGLPEAVVAFFQPIYHTRERRVVGFEALARLRAGDGLLTPDQFLSTLDAEGSLKLFHAMLGQAIAFLGHVGPQPADLFVTINVGAATLMHGGFFEMLRFALECHDGVQSRLMVEILEDEAIVDRAAMMRAIAELKALGFTIALDDVGSAYASLVRIKDLPVDVLKLDREFSGKLAEHPEDLQFIASMLGLARGLDRRLIVEGVETADILDALTIMGVDYVQGHGIARPMPASTALSWLASPAVAPPSREPTSLLGVYAAHLTIVEACRVLAGQPMRLRWHEEAADPHRCDIGRFLDRHGLHDTSFGLAHRRFHGALAVDKGGSGSWRAAAEELRHHLLAALRQERDEARDHASAAEAGRADAAGDSVPATAS